MAALTATQLGDRIPMGKHVQVSFSIAAAGDNSAVEWIATGLSSIIAVTGLVAVGAAPFANAPSVQLNARGTGVTVDTNPGDLGIEVEAAGDNTLQVTVLGIV